MGLVGIGLHYEGIHLLSHETSAGHVVLHVFIPLTFRAWPVFAADQDHNHSQVEGLEWNDLLEDENLQELLSLKRACSNSSS